MRVVLLVISLMALGACGPSSAQIKTAKTAEYKAPSSQILDIAVQIAQRTYQVNDIDPQKSTFTTAGQWYSAEGGRRGTTNEGNGDYVHAGGGDVNLRLEVQVLGARLGRVVVVITPHTLQLVAGSPQPRELKPDDPNLPPWVNGRVDSLAMDIYSASKQFVQPL